MRLKKLVAYGLVPGRNADIIHRELISNGNILLFI